MNSSLGATKSSKRKETPMAKFIRQPRTETELKENEAAIAWLARKGLTPYEISYFKWRWIDHRAGKIIVPRESRLGDYKVAFSYANSPMATVADRLHGKNIFVFYQDTTRLSEGFPAGRRYTVDEVVAIVQTRKIKAKAVEKPKKVLTLPPYLVQWKYRKQFYN